MSSLPISNSAAVTIAPSQTSPHAMSVSGSHLNIMANMPRLPRARSSPTRIPTAEIPTPARPPKKRDSFSPATILLPKRRHDVPDRIESPLERNHHPDRREQQRADSDHPRNPPRRSALTQVEDIGA